ncbi:kinase-like domain-containing protein [Trametes elegans]|nr:kinase-like domain-containing protein [Trametes elegans]
MYFFPYRSTPDVFERRVAELPTSLTASAAAAGHLPVLVRIWCFCSTMVLQDLQSDLTLSLRARRSHTWLIDLLSRTSPHAQRLSGSVQRTDFDAQLALLLLLNPSSPVEAELGLSLSLLHTMLSRTPTARARFVAVSGREQTRRDESAPPPQETKGLWGSLVPCNTDLPQYDLRKACPEYRIGSGSGSGVAGITLPGLDPSAVDCVLHWDGDESSKSAVKVTDFSRGRGTFINGMRIGPGHHRILRDGNELSFGDSRYRFVYRHKACNASGRTITQVYDVHRVLGSGTFGTVTKALHRRKGAWYAIKTISTTKIPTWGQEIRNPGGPQSEEAQRVMREIAVLERLTHPNICEMRESFIDEDSIHLVLEFVPGGHLGTLIRNRSFYDEPFKEEETQRISYQICQALAYMHSRQIAHRDLKPENVLLTRDDPPVIKVADFGLAKAFSSASKLLVSPNLPFPLSDIVTLIAVRMRDAQIHGTRGNERLRAWIQ